MSSIDDKIRIIDKSICRHIENAGFSPRGAVSQDILSQLRNFLEHIMLKFYANGNDINNTYENICEAIKFVQSRGDLKVLYKFHDYLQIVASHYTLDEENSERLMLKYYQNLLDVKNLLHDRFGLDVLANLDDFPLHIDETLQEYYEKIAEKVCRYDISHKVATDKYYIQKIKPFFVNHKVYYEVTFTPANDYASKFSRVIAFTKIRITDYYAAKFSLANECIEILGKTMPILVITGWEVAIRDCEYKNFISVLCGQQRTVNYKEQQNITRYLTETGFSLTDLVDFPKAAFNEVQEILCAGVRNPIFVSAMELSRNIIENHKAGENLLRYFLYQMNNKVIKAQRQPASNDNLSGLHLQNRCIPFDTMPFIRSLIGHNPRLSDLFNCIPAKERKHELLARCVRNNSEINGQLFTTVSDIEGFGDVAELAQKYNEKLWFGHKEQSKLVIENGQLFINGYKNDTCYIINKLKILSSTGIQNYSHSVEAWLNSPDSGVDCDEKRATLIQMYENSKVALIYGSAGTGKSTFINHVAHFWADKRKLFLCQTNPAVDNLKRRVTASNCTFLTISKFLCRKAVQTDYDLLVIDESSTVSNADMRKVLENANFQLLLLVGDTYQISSIRFGNWFSVARAFVPDTSVFELTVPYRSNDDNLKLLWKRVRNMEDTIQELIARQKYSITLDASIFDNAEDDEIILCLNYDGLYGINNINRFLQESNPSNAVQWGIQQYKIGDPILFNESDRFAPAIYNNMKGKIVGIEVVDPDSVAGYIQFDIELTKVINGMDAWMQDFELLGNSPHGNSVIRFKVYKTRSTDEDDEGNSRAVVPFQVAYAVSIHKAQGLEFRSVKIVITDEVDELITHSIFYTAISRAQNKLQIYWTPEVENKVLTSIQPRNINNDVGLLRLYIR